MTALITAPATVEISGLTEPAIARYFEQLNAGRFTAAAQLFASDGELQPPFETAIAGRRAIAAYLQREADGIQCQPATASSTAGQVRVLGRAQTPYFTINVAWQFTLSPKQEIASLGIELLASPEELLRLSH